MSTSAEESNYVQGRSSIVRLPFAQRHAFINPVSNHVEIATRMRMVCINIRRTTEDVVGLCRHGRQVTRAHDLLSEVVNAMFCNGVRMSLLRVVGVRLPCRAVLKSAYSRVAP